MALLTALAAAYGGYGQGRQQALQNRQEQERLDQEQAYRQAEEKRQNAQLLLEQQRGQRESDTYTRSTGIDPATGKPFLMPLSTQRIVPGKVGTNYKPTLQDLYNHQMLMYSTLQSQGRPDAAAGWLAQGQETGRLLAAQQAQEATYNRDVQLNNMTTDREAQIHGAPTYADLNPKPLTPSEQMTQDQEQWNRAHGYPPGYRGNDIGQQTARKATRLKGDFDEFWTNATTVPTTTNAAGMKIPVQDPKTHQPAQPTIPAAAQQALRDEFAKMDETDKPQAYADSIIKKLPNAPKAVIEALKRRAAWRQAELDAERGYSGGSNDSTRPPAVPQSFQ